MRLQRMERPQLTALRKTINRDIERLKALPHVDTVGNSVRLDNLIAAVDKLPLAMEVRPQPDQTEEAPKNGAGNAWSRLWRAQRATHELNTSSVSLPCDSICRRTISW